MATVSIARRYARALLEAETKGGSLDKTAEQLWALAQLIKTNPELQQLFANPSFSRAQRLATVEKLLGLLGEANPILANLGRLLVERDRTLLLPDIARLFRDLVDTRAGRVRGEITSAVPLSSETMTQLEQSLEKAMQRDVVLQSKVDPELLGGISARVGSLLFDGSLRTQLAELRSQLQSR